MNYAPTVLVVLAALATLGIFPTKARAWLARYVSPVVVVVVGALLGLSIGAITALLGYGLISCAGEYCEIWVVIQIMLIGLSLSAGVSIVLIVMYMRTIQKYFSKHVWPWVVVVVFLVAHSALFSIAGYRLWV